jgi:undecaprenyl diphosphate synthase
MSSPSNASETRSAQPEALHIPTHLALICDGNRRWAREHGLPSMEGHRRGLAAIRRIADYSRELGIHTLTIWGFSTENWNRSKIEINYLMKIFNGAIDDWLEDAMRQNVRIVHLGRKDHLPSGLLKKLAQAEQKTINNSKHVLNIALDYGGEDEAMRAVQKMLETAKSLEEAKKMAADGLEPWLDTADQPHPRPELIIRTSGEQRLSGFMPLQSSYAEYYFTPVNLPDFGEEQLLEALQDFTNRDRRFGGNSPK